MRITKTMTCCLFPPWKFWLKFEYQLSSALTRCISLASSMSETEPTITAQSAFSTRGMPDLGLDKNLEAEFRVYVLLCADGYLYVGLAHKSWVGRRIQAHFDGNGSHFTQSFKPSKVCLVWPAQTRAVEAYVYFALLETVGEDRCKRVGGWTQTSSKLSPLVHLQVKEARRGLEGTCFNCGGNHYADKCPGRHQQLTCWYPCKRCGEKMYLTSRGQTPGADVVQSGLSVPGSIERETEKVPHALGVAKRPAEQASSGETADVKRRKTQGMGCTHVRICGNAYTTLAWYTGASNPLKSACAAARLNCFEKAVELTGGDSKTLVAQAFASKPPGRGRELLPDRERLPHDWVETECASVSSSRIARKDDSFLQMRKARNGARCVLWRIHDLEAVL